MNLEEAIELVDTAIAPEYLDDLQVKIFHLVWEGLSYAQIAEQTTYGEQHIKREGAEIWRKLTKALGESVTKKNFRTVLKRNSDRLRDRRHQADIDRIKPQEEKNLSFYGRQTDLQTLEAWIGTPCRLIGIFGLGGIGKTTLAERLSQQVRSRFDIYVWRSLRQAPPLNALLDEILPSLTNSEAGESSIAALMEVLRRKRCLLILDNIESILQSGDRSGDYQVGYEEYRQLFDRICDDAHQSCIVLTGREKPSGLAVREGTNIPIRALQLQGLSGIEGQQLLAAQGLETTASQSQDLINHFGGNPLALKLAATTIKTLWAGDARAFLAQGSTVSNNLWELLEEQFQGLSPLQQKVMNWLAINREGVIPTKLETEILPKVPSRKLSEALEALYMRSLIESCEVGSTQQPVIMEYVTERFIQHLEQEIIKGKLDLLITYAIVESQTQDNVRDAQIQFIVNPLVERLLSHFETKSQLEQHLKNILAALRDRTESQTGYAAGNLLNLFCYLKTDLKNFDFSNLYIRQAYLLSASLQDTDFTGAKVTQTAFANTFGGVLNVAFSPNGKYLASSDTKGEIQIWDTYTGDLLLRCRGHQHWTWAIAFSPNHQYFASASDDYLVKLWDVETGECLQTYTGHSYIVCAVAFSPNSQTIASSGQDATIRLWSALPTTQNPEIMTLDGLSGRVWSLAFSPDGQTLASAGEDCIIRLWDVATGTCRCEWQAHERWMRSIAFSPDGSLIASGSFDHTIKIWDATTQTLVKTLVGHRQLVTDIAFSPDSSQIASSSYDKTVRCWDISTGECVKTFFGHSSRIWSVSFHCSGSLLASGGDDHVIKLWDLKTDRCTKTFQGHTNAVLSLALNSTDLNKGCGYLASGYEDQAIRLWDIREGKLVQTLRGHTNRVWSVAFQPSSSQSSPAPLLASSSADWTVKLWNYQSGNCLKTFSGHTSWVWSVAFSPDGTKLASGSYDHTVKLWDVSTGECLRTFDDYPCAIAGITFSPDGKLLASSDFSGIVKIWNLETYECDRIFNEHKNSAWSVKFSPDGAWLLSCSLDQTLKLWDVATGKCLRTFVGHQGAIFAIQFSPDAKFIISAGLDRALKLWNIETGEIFQVMEGHAEVIYTMQVGSVPLSQEGVPKLIAVSGSMDECIKVWDLENYKCLQTLRIPRPYEGMKLDGIQGLTNAQRETLKALGALESSHN
ncbi:NB-ARC domain-containing protein [Tumidithrix elongata RA019]|uniref:NB-ARC domain-containing protein n=1 Tax=Tumidithrix elongata BACA0141 TaxID=2716417 RepID=A0AAW9PUA3_9CYAN|nr:NB-ARC domain-containing protein [Tumidithrix elongata RA019]